MRVRRTSPEEEDRRIAQAIEDWHRLHEWADSVINLANRISRVPCWACGAFRLTAHRIGCAALRPRPQRYLVPCG